ncbi:hypothetical protein B0H63DRAFT_480428 [Podospora didyma]|uniref:RapZ C-terminal domain-containing protein n=1 Tax=Podospora didyma TaxID=330526 RepID=A0AAE0KLE0_9PEZI|nr:hypothetical protein B0H63DRAFT_480428 [Podospora didyma]
MGLEAAEPPRPILLLVSHARTNPLSPAPDLKYDIRPISNPPKPIRDKYTGVDKRLRGHMLSHGDFLSLLDHAETEIKELMQKMSVSEPGELISATQTWTSPSSHVGMPPELLDSGYARNGNSDEIDDIEEDDDGNRQTLRVSMFCVRGRHRSVAFAEELALRSWPSSWEIRVHHRDLGRPKKETGSRNTDHRGSRLGRGFLADEVE